MWVMRRCAVMVLLVSLLISASPATAQSRGTPFTATEVACTVTPGREWSSGGVFHLRGAIEHFIIIKTSEPLMSGTDTVVANGNLNETSGDGEAWGTFSIQPLGVNGAWDGIWDGAIKAFQFGPWHATMHGSGVLLGMQVEMTITVIDIPAGRNPCAPGHPQEADMLTGQIVDLGR